MTSNPPPVQTSAPYAAAEPAAEDRAPSPDEAAAPVGPRRGWLRALRAIVLIVVLPVAALGIGLLVAWIVHIARGNGSTSTATIPPSPSPSPSAPRTSASPRVTAPPAVAVPADWVTEVSPPVGLIFRHPPGWVRRTATPEVLRFAPASAGSTTPGIEGVGVGVEAATSPAAAIDSFAARVYGGEPGYALTAPAAAGTHAGEQAAVVTYRRAGVAVRVVVHAFREGSRTVLVLGRATQADAARAGQLAAMVEASAKLAG